MTWCLIFVGHKYVFGLCKYIQFCLVLIKKVTCSGLYKYFQYVVLVPAKLKFV